MEKDINKSYSLYQDFQNKEFFEVIGENYQGSYERTRVTCRGIIIKDNQILLSCESKNNILMTPGGGLENNETEKECVIREVEEETGYTIIPSECILENIEYYKNVRYINKYFYGEVVGHTNSKLTEQEIRNGMIAKWVDLTIAIENFKTYPSIKNYELKRALYLREYMVLSKLVKYIKD